MVNTRKRLITAYEVDEMLGRAKGTTYQQKFRGDLPFPYVKIGSSLRFRQEDVEQYIQDNTVQPAGRAS